MEVNLPVWNYYPRDDQTFVDPLYVPYVKTLVENKPGCAKGGPDDTEICGINTWAKQGYADGFVNPATVRKGLGWDFVRMHPQYDPCPHGFSEAEGGWCVLNQQEYGDHGLYSEHAFVPKYQYWQSYAPRIKNARFKQINQFDMRSVNPFTGNYVMYFNPKPASNRAKYGYLPAKDSYLA